MVTIRLQSIDSAKMKKSHIRCLSQSKWINLYVFVCLFNPSYLGLGLKAARLGIMLTERDQSQATPSNSSSGLNDANPMNVFGKSW